MKHWNCCLNRRNKKVKDQKKKVLFLFCFSYLASNRIILDDPVMVIDPSILGEHGNIDLKPDEKEIQRRIAMSVIVIIIILCRIILNDIQF